MIPVNSRPKAVSPPSVLRTTQTKADTFQVDKTASVLAHTEDEMTVSQKAREAMAKQTAAPAEEAGGVTEELPDTGGDPILFPSFSGVFGKVTQEYSEQIRDYYAKEHEENLTYEDPRLHVWDKYKNPKSPEFRAELSEDERAWAYDHELDLLNGGKHLQMTNPYVFPEGAPTLADAALKANQICREQLDQALQDILTQNEMELPEDAVFTLMADETYTIHVTGLEDEELTAALEEALNCGENGKNLYGHLKLNTPKGEALSVDYANGHLSAVDPELEWDDRGLREVKMQAGPAWTRYSTTYNPSQGPLSDKILSLDPDTQYTREQFDRLCSAVRMGAREAIEEYRTTHPQKSLEDVYDPSEFIPTVPDTPDSELPAVPETPDSESSASAPPVARAALLSETAPVRAVSAAANEGETTFVDHWDVQEANFDKIRGIVQDYYYKQHRENMRFPDPYQHIVDKYINYNSPYFRSDLTEQERRLCKEQEEACLYGSHLTFGCYYDVALRGEDRRTFTDDIQAINDTRSQICQSIDDLLRKNGITLPEGASFKLKVNPYDYYIHVEGLKDQWLTEAVERALNVGQNGERLYLHIEFSDPEPLDGPRYSQYYNADPWKRSLYQIVERLTGYDIRTLDRHDKHFWTPDGRDLWSVLKEANFDGYYRLGDHAGLYCQLARDGWNSTPDAYRSLVYQDGTLHDPDVLKGAPSESEWQGKVLDIETKKMDAYLVEREETLRKEAADRAAGITSTGHFGPRASNEFTQEELDALYPSSPNRTDSPMIDLGLDWLLLRRLDHGYRGGYRRF